jgi:hypothetical protein
MACEVAGRCVSRRRIGAVIYNLSWGMIDDRAGDSVVLAAIRMDRTYPVGVSVSVGADDARQDERNGNEG